MNVPKYGYYVKQFPYLKNKDGNETSCSGNFQHSLIFLFFAISCHVPRGRPAPYN
jgi:hypothetical protein